MDGLQKLSENAVVFRKWRSSYHAYVDRVEQNLIYEKDLLFSCRCMCNKAQTAKTLFRSETGYLMNFHSISDMNKQLPHPAQVPGSTAETSPLAETLTNFKERKNDDTIKSKTIQ